MRRVSGHSWARVAAEVANFRWSDTPQCLKGVMVPNLGGWEWVILAVVALVLFGGAKVANLGKNAGKAIREFKEETQSIKSKPEQSTPEAKPAADESNTADGDDSPKTS